MKVEILLWLNYKEHLTNDDLEVGEAGSGDDD